MILASGLHSLTLGRDFNQSLHKKSLSCGLQMLMFGHVCDQDIRNTTLPSSLQHLTFGCCFNHRLDGMSLPRNLQVFTFWFSFPSEFGRAYTAKQSSDTYIWHCIRPEYCQCYPASGLQTLNIGKYYSHSFDNLIVSCPLIVNVARHFEAQHGYGR